MPKKESGKLWQLAHKDKVNQYNKTYRQNKTITKVVIDPWLKAEIDKVKPPDLTYGGWLRQLAEEWGRKSIESR